MHGARRGCSEGIQGASYAIPLLDSRSNPLPLHRIALFTHRFLQYASGQAATDYHLGDLAHESGYPCRHLAPLFASAPVNCLLPVSWHDTLKPYRALKEFPIRVAVVGRWRTLSEMELRSRMNRLTARLDRSRTGILYREEGELSDRVQSWAGSEGLRCFGFPVYWRDIHVPHATIRHGSVGKRYNQRAGEETEIRILANATHMVGMPVLSPTLSNLAKELSIPFRRLTSRDPARQQSVQENLDSPNGQKHKE